MQNTKITVAYSTRYTNNKYKQHIHNTSGLPNNQIEVIEQVNNNEYSLTSVYNKFIKQSKTQYIVLIHDDLVLPKNWLKRTLMYLEQNPDYGILGIAGTTKLHKSCKWWTHRPNMVGRVHHQESTIHPKTNKPYYKVWESKYSGKFKDKLIDVVAIDGLFMAINKDKISNQQPFDETINGFHFYDISFCLSEYMNKTMVGVITDLGKVIHKSVGKITNPDGSIKESWENNRLKLVEQYNDKLPLEIKPEIIYEDKTYKLTKRPTTTVIINYNEKDNFVECISSIITKTSPTNNQNYLDTLEFKVLYNSNLDELESIIELFKRTFDDLNIETVLSTGNFAKDINNLQINTNNIFFIQDYIVLLNDFISAASKYNHKTKNDFIVPRIHKRNNTVHSLGGELAKLDDKEKKGVQYIVPRNIAEKSSYSYNLNTVNKIDGFMEDCFFMKSDILNKYKFNEELKMYYFGYDMCTNNVKAVCQIDSVAQLQKDYQIDKTIMLEDYRKIFEKIKNK